MSTPIPLTESELRSLRGLKAPDWWQSEALQSPHISSHTANTPHTRTLPFRSQLCDRRLPQILAGKVVTRHYLNPRAIVAVGEHQSLVHLPGVGTRWQRLSHQETIIERRILFRQVFLTIGALLRPTLRAKRPKRLDLDLLLPYPPSPFSVQRNFNLFIATSDCKATDLALTS